ncbi:patatin-like phospholipase family protein [Bradyrhizobium huanghuaihaiense]|uniref:patatin-like phospholipase family protein n=1 Tax=Bradyrhizobium huanghuaihaiense TaxID=990078 RepID=UPI0021A99C65|nr:patatin-like phospholipase family protein [Bradyrhizobium sp. CB3035]UWU80619.1 patatin-like phospholipase family protein [Bradyrhizobium sp. CB3035]
MSEKMVGAQIDGGSQVAGRTAASRLLFATDIWSGAPSPPPTPEPASVTPPAPVAAAQPPRPVGVITVAAPVAPVPAPSRQWPPQKLSLALQGGGTFAAFTWGVLERLLEEPDIEIDTISGASAGAVNALLLASGLAEGGREAARSRLNRFWVRLMHEASFRSLMLVGGFSPAGSSVAFGPTLRSGQFDPFDLDPLRQALSRDINFAALRAAKSPKLLIAATRIRDGQQQIFRNDAITADVALASTCPPLVHCAVEIDGEAYWDGGFGGNPPLVRLVQETAATDVLLVQVTPSRDSYVPITLAAIDRRLDQIAANAALNAEVAAIAWAQAQTAPSLRLSRIAAEDSVDGLAQRSSTDLGRGFIRLLHRSGREAAERWLGQAAIAGAAPPVLGQRVAAGEPALA